jgi:hypothetical protein
MSTVPSSLKTKESRTGLGHVAVPERTFERDLEVSDRYQAYSAEVLRLALLGIAGIGFLLVNLGPSSEVNPFLVAAYQSQLAPSLYAALGCLGLSASLSLAHRYLSADTLAYHLRALRLDIRNVDGDSDQAKREREGRDIRFTICRWLLGLAAGFLAIGAVALAWGFSSALRAISLIFNP